MRHKSPRLAARAIILHDNRLLVVNAYPAGKSTLLCAPGGGVEIGASLHDNLKREVHEETGLEIEVGAPCLLNEFHDPRSSFHQVDIFFRCTIVGDPRVAQNWKDPERVVSKWVWLTEAELARHPHKPSSLARVAFGSADMISYDPLEPIVR
ncbi:MAG: NUDIX domain-containing protein [Pseudomonadota bacterium]